MQRLERNLAFACNGGSVSCCDVHHHVYDVDSSTLFLSFSSSFSIGVVEGFFFHWKA
jgi:hypothetical protein